VIYSGEALPRLNDAYGLWQIGFSYWIKDFVLRVNRLIHRKGRKGFAKAAGEMQLSHAVGAFGQMAGWVRLPKSLVLNNKYDR
jgi:hypothetical protein